jgi:hypothetical protein
MQDVSVRRRRRRHCGRTVKKFGCPSFSLTVQIEFKNSLSSLDCTRLRTSRTSFLRLTRYLFLLYFFFGVARQSVTYLAKILWHSGLDSTTKVIEIYQVFTASNTGRLLSITDAKCITTIHRYKYWALDYIQSIYSCSNTRHIKTIRNGQSLCNEITFKDDFVETRMYSLSPFITT